MEKKCYKIKIKAISQIKNLSIVFLSDVMRQQFKNHEMIKDRYSTVISNAVNYHKFHRIERAQARTMFGIDNNAVVFVFVAVSLNDKRKGFRVLHETLKRMKIPQSIILAIGENKDLLEEPLIKSTGPIYESERLSAAYSCADYFVLPSYQETFGQTLTEALACGIPVITFPVDITSELITRKKWHTMQWFYIGRFGGRHQTCHECNL